MSDKAKELQSRVRDAVASRLSALKAGLSKRKPSALQGRDGLEPLDAGVTSGVEGAGEGFAPLYADDPPKTKMGTLRGRGASMLSALKRIPSHGEGGRAAFSFGRKVRTEADAESEEAAPANAVAHGKGVVPVLLHLDNNREVICLLKPDGSVVREGEADAGVTYLVFSAQDYRYRSGSVSHSKAMSIALEDQGQAVRLVNRSSELGAFYTRAQDAMADYVVQPGGQLADWLLKSEGLAKSFPRVVGFNLGDPDGAGVSLVVLYYYDASGEVGRPQISINPQSLEFALSQFATSRKIQLEEVPVSIFGAEQFRKAQKRAVSYLNEDLILGKTKGTWIQYGLAASALALLASVGAGGYYYTRVELAQKGAEEAAAAARKLVADRKSLLMESTQSLGAAFALDGVGLLEKAETIWRPGYAVELETDRAGIPVITVKAEMPKSLAPDERKALLDSVTALKAPEGCVKDNLLITGGLSEAKVSIKCASQSGAPDAYRPR